MRKISFIGKSHRNSVTLSPVVKQDNGISRLTFNGLNRKQRRFIERKMKEV